MEIVVLILGGLFVAGILMKSWEESKGSSRSVSRPTATPLPRAVIPERVRHEVWRRDQGRCVDCGSQARLEFDHVIPVSRGGSNTARNLQLLCEACNRRKGARI